MVSLACLKICFRLVATVLFFFISRPPFLCALSTSNIGSVSHPAGDRPSHPICETALSEGGNPPLQGKKPHTDNLAPWRLRSNSVEPSPFVRRPLPDHGVENAPG